MERFKRLTPTREQREYVKENLHRAKGLDNPKTFQVSEQNKYYGYLGEVVICDLYGVPRPVLGRCDTGHDLVINGVRCDVKTRLVNVEPRLDYYVKVYKQQIKVFVDAYIFLFYHKPTDSFRVGGVIDKPAFMKLSRFFKVGSVVADCYEIKTKKEEQYCLRVGTTAPLMRPGEVKL